MSAVTQYIGSRYVPKLADPIEWSRDLAYEALTIVTYQGDSYTSRQKVPKGVDILDESYWAPTGNYNAQIEAYRREVRAYDRRIKANAQAIADEQAARIEADARLTDDLAAEIEARTSADTALSDDIEAEQAARIAADDRLTDDLRNEIQDRILAIGDMSLSLANEREARLAADSTLADQIRKDGIKSLYVMPEYVGSFTAQNGYLMQANGANKPDPYISQGMTVTTDGEFKVLVFSAGYASCKVYTAHDVDHGNNVVAGTQSFTAFGHGNVLDFNPVTQEFYINGGEADQIICNSSFDVIARVTLPNTQNQYGGLFFDRATGHTYGLSYDGSVYSFDPETYALAKIGDISGLKVNQGAAIYNDLLFTIYDGGGSQKDYRLAIYVYDLKDFTHIGTISLPIETAWYPLGEVEDLSFDNDGTLYISTLLRYDGAMDYAGTTCIFRINPFVGQASTGKTYNYVQPPNIYVECANYAGFYSNGSYNYPLKSLEELSFMLQALPKTRVVKMGLESSVSSTAPQTWKGMIQITGVMCTLHMNGANNITIQGQLLARDNAIIKTRNRLTMQPWFHQTNQAFINAYDSILEMSTIVGVENAQANATTIDGMCQFGGSGSACINGITPLSGASNVKSNFNGGMGYVIGAPKAGSF